MSSIGFLTNINFMASQLKELPKSGKEVWLLRFLLLSVWFSFYAVVEYVICNFFMRIESRINAGRQKAFQQLKENQALLLSTQTTTTVKPNHDREPSTTLNDDEEGQQQQNPPLPTDITKQDVIDTGLTAKLDTYLMNEKGMMRVSPGIVDDFSRVVYPIAYLIACIVLWAIQAHETST